MIKLPDECLAKKLTGTCEPLAQIISDDKAATFDCCGRILQENRIDPACKFRTCQGYPEGDKLKVMSIDTTEGELISVMSNIASALFVIAIKRDNAEIKPFKKPVLVVDNGRGADGE